MQTTVTAPQAASATITPERFSLYTSIHKALRSCMCDTLCRVGRLDTNDADEMSATLGQLDTLLSSCADHIEHENHFVHAAIEARLPAGAARTAADHVEHADSIEALRCEAAALAAAPAEQRMPLALRLYRHLALFVAENFQHMHIEETANAAALWAHYSDAELLGIHDRLMASIPPQGHLLVARWMVPAIGPAERSAMLNGMKLQTPPEAFLGVLEHVRPHLDATGWDKLARAVGVPQVRGLVDMR
ncbi:MAG: hypothetical protein ABI671_07890 [Burkholderiales bacterium]